MYQLLTGRLPFGAPTVLATLQSIQNDSPLVPQSIEPNITDELSDLTMGLLEKQPANRPQTAAQLIEMFDADRASWPLHVNRYAASNLETREFYTNQTQPAKTGNATWSSRLWQAVALTLIAGAAWWWSPQIIRIATDQGEVVIEAHDDAVEVQVFENGELIRVVDTKTQQAFDLKSGNYTIKATGNDSAAGAFEVKPNSLVMKRGEQQIVRVTQQPNAKVELDHQLEKAKEMAASGQGRAVANDNLPKGATVTTSVIQRPSAKINIDQSGQAPSKWTYEVAKKEYQIAQLEYERIKGLNKKGSASAYDVKRAQYAMEIAYAKIEEVRHQSKKAKEKAASRQGRAVTNGNCLLYTSPSPRD